MNSNNWEDVISDLKKPVDCEGVDIQQLEDASVNIVNNIQDYILNIDVTQA